jgi:hypothetical protein
LKKRSEEKEENRASRKEFREICSKKSETRVLLKLKSSLFFSKKRVLSRCISRYRCSLFKRKEKKRKEKKRKEKKRKEKKRYRCSSNRFFALQSFLFFLGKKEKSASRFSTLDKTGDPKTKKGKDVSNKDN